METLLHIEMARAKNHAKQVLVVGHSRMAGFRPRVANELTDQTGYVFGTIALAGTSARVWSYNIPIVDPNRNLYSAVIVPSDDYDEPDGYDDPRNREVDLHYLVANLRLRDIPEFSRSFARPDLRWKAVRGILLKGTVYKRDFIEFLPHPVRRIQKVDLYRRDAAGWLYDFNGGYNSLAGLSIDWDHQVAHFPDHFTAARRKLIKDVIFEARPPDQGIATSYYRQWLGHIVDYYRNSATRVVFVRFPRGPVPPPSHPPKLNSAVRQFASERHVIVMDEHRFDSLERPELFTDPLHLNRPGMESFSHTVARAVAAVLARPTP